MTANKETVILLHGIGLTGGSLFLLRRFLNKKNYAALSITYPSTKLDIDSIADWLFNTHLTAEFWDKNARVHFATHSMGGLVVQRYLTKYRYLIPVEKLGRVVMMGPPNQGSEIADKLKNFLPYRWLFGPAGANLTTHHYTNKKEDLYYDIGIIAGSSRWLYPLSALLIPGKSDGRVSVERTKIPAMKDHVTINTSHTFMIYRRDIHHYILNFLKHGAFHNVQ